jgi:Ca2+-binding RTX toxin-like protein
MEILFIMPILIGLAIYSLFDSGSSDSGSNVPNNDDTPTPTPTDTDLVFVGTTGADTLSGGTGRDFILGGSGTDKIEGNKDYDLLLGEGGTDFIFGGRGYDTIFGGAGADSLSGLDGEDYLIGGSGDDVVYGGEGSDALIGSNGSDRLVGDNGDDFISGYDISSDTTALQVNMGGGTVQETEAALTDLELAISARFSDDVTGTNSISTLIDRVKSALNEKSSNLGDDSLFGGRGDDTILADYSDTIVSGSGNDVLTVQSDGANQAVVVIDFIPGLDKLNIFVPASTTNTAYSLVNGTTPPDEVSVVVAGDVVAVLKGLTAADIRTGSIVVTKSA